MSINKITVAIVCLSLAVILQAIRLSIIESEFKSLKSECQKQTELSILDNDNNHDIQFDLPDGEDVTKKTIDGNTIFIEYYIVKDGKLVEVTPI